MINILYKAIFSPLEVFNRDNVKGRLKAACFTVIITALLGSVIAPLINFYNFKDRYEINLDISGMLTRLVMSIATWLLVCASFLLLSKAFGKEIRFEQIASTWGISYIPNFLCVILYNLLLIKPEINNGSGFAAFIISTVFIMLLVWKAIFYFMLMRFVINTTLCEITIITVVSAVVFVIVIMIGSKVGIQVPML